MQTRFKESMLALKKKQEFMLLIQEAIRKLRKEGIDSIKLDGIVHNRKQLLELHFLIYKIAT